MHGLAVVAQRFLSESFRVTALLGSLRPGVAIGVQGHPFDTASAAVYIRYST